MTVDQQLDRFLEAQELNYPIALKEIQKGTKRSHWMWYIFPQINGLGSSSTSRYYAIKNLHEATAYLQHAMLGSRLLEITNVLLSLPATDPIQVFGRPDDAKLKSCMTLFAQVPNSNPAFQAVLDKFFEGKPDLKTLDILNMG